MPYGLAGTDLEIDLSQGKVETREGDSELNEAYVGGRGVGTRMFWDRVPPEIPPFSPDNLLIFSVGLLTGTLAPGANRAAIITRSPQTNLLTYSILGGFWGAELKHAGYDNLIISGKSPTPAYIWINDERVEIRDAGHLWGKEVRETQRIIREELDRDKVQILCIGPAGENRVYVASIEHGFGSGASRAGVGAVMGDKNLKAIAVYGTKDLNVAKPSEFHETCERILKKTDRIKKYWDDWSNEAGKWLLNDGVYGNLDTHMPFEDSVEWLEDFAGKLRTRVTTCYNCVIGCKAVLSLPDGAYSYVKCQSWFNFLLACKIRDLTFSVKCYNLCELYGLDVISTANIVAFAIDLYENGILTKGETEGMHLEWGNEDVAFSLIEKITRREGIGALLANGVYEAARQIGRGAEEHAFHQKKLEALPFQLYKPCGALRSSITDKPDMTRAEGFIVQEGLAESREWKEDCLRSDFFSYPKKFEKVFLDDYVGLERDYEKMVPFTSYEVDKNSLADCTGICIFWAGFWRYNPISFVDHLNLISYATGIDMDENKAMMIAKRSAALIRAYNVITGIRRKNDTVHEKYFRDPPKPPFELLDRDKFDRMISEFYKLRGWNDDGIPSGEELDRLGLQFVRKDLEQRGIL